MAVEVILPAGAGGQEKAMVAAFLQLNDEACDALLGDGVFINDDSPVQVVFPAEADKKLADLLPSYRVPEIYFAMARFPITTSGKADRKELREMGASFTAQQLAEMRTSSRGPKRQPTTEMERTLQQLWAWVLNIDADSIGLDDSFFRLGGDSIAAMKLVSEALKEKVDICAADIFHNPKLASLAHVMRRMEHVQQQSYRPFSLISTAEKDYLHTVMPALPHDGQTVNMADFIPATHMQNLFISIGMQTPRATHNYFFIDLGTIVDVSRLRQSCYTLLQHFPILRTLFVFLGDRLWQAVLRDLDLPFTEIEFDTGLEEGSRAMCMRDREQSLPSVLPTKFMLACNSAKKYRLVIRLSHAQYDGVCIPVIMRTLLSIYQQGSLPPLPGFSTYLAYTKNRQPASARYWRELLEGSHMTNVTSKLCPKTQDATPRKVQAERVLGMPALPADITMASLVSSAWAKVLFRITGEEDVVYGHLVTGRNSKIPGITEIVGPCLNVIPVRALISPTRTSKELIRSIQQQYVSLGESDSMDFDELVRTCTDWPATTEFDSTLQHQNVNEHPEVELNGITRKVGWFENPYVVPDRFYIISYPQGDTLKLVAAGNTAIVTTRNAKMVLQMLYETIKELSNQL
jgi:aryl carrier-like protein